MYNTYRGDVSIVYEMCTGDGAQRWMRPTPPFMELKVWKINTQRVHFNRMWRREGGARWPACRASGRLHCRGNTWFGWRATWNFAGPAVGSALQVEGTTGRERQWTETRGGTGEGWGPGQEIAALHFILEATENQERISSLGVTQSVSWEGYLHSGLGDALGWQWFQWAVETGGETR